MQNSKIIIPPPVENYPTFGNRCPICGGPLEEGVCGNCYYDGEGPGDYFRPPLTRHQLPVFFLTMLVAA